MPKPPVQHTAFIDALRGTAALLVVFFHAQLHVVADYPAQTIAPGSFTDIFVFGWIDLGKYAVAVFFIISGFLIPTTLARSGLVTFGKRRFFRLYPAYWLAIAVALCFERHSLWQVLANLTMLQGYLHQPDLIGAFWTLQIEITYYAICAGLFASSAKIFQCRGVMLASAIFAAIAGAAIKYKTGVGVPVAMLIAFCLMILGDSLRHKDKFLPLRFAAVALALIPICLLAYPDAASRYALSYELALVTFAAAFVARAAIKPGRLITFFGDISYSVYLLHGVLGLRAALWARALGGGALLIHCANFSATILAASIVYYALEKPAISFSRQ